LLTAFAVSFKEGDESEFEQNKFFTPWNIGTKTHLEQGRDGQNGWEA